MFERLKSMVKCHILIPVLLGLLLVSTLTHFFEIRKAVKVEAIIGKCVYYKVPIKRDYITVVDCGKGYKISQTKVTNL